MRNVEHQGAPFTFCLTLNAELFLVALKLLSVLSIGLYKINMEMLFVVHKMGEGGGGGWINRRAVAHLFKGPGIFHNETGFFKIHLLFKSQIC
jgi:hypothetical protein